MQYLCIRLFFIVYAGAPPKGGARSRHREAGPQAQHPPASPAFGFPPIPWGDTTLQLFLNLNGRAVREAVAGKKAWFADVT